MLHRRLHDAATQAVSIVTTSSSQTKLPRPRNATIQTAPLTIDDLRKMKLEVSAQETAMTQRKLPTPAPPTPSDGARAGSASKEKPGTSSRPATGSGEPVAPARASTAMSLSKFLESVLPTVEKVTPEKFVDHNLN